MKVTTKFNYKKAAPCSECGSGICNKYGGVKVDEWGSDIPNIIGKHDLYAEIQSYKNDTEMSRVLDILGLSADDASYSLFDDSEDNVVDLTKIPRTLGNWFNYQKRLEYFWDSLNPEVREEIGSIKNVPDYLTAELSKLNADISQPVEPPVDDVKGSDE